MTTSTDATIAFTATSGAKTSCKLDGGSLAACSNPVTYSGLSAGTHTFVVKATISRKTASANVSWQVTASAPASAAFSVTSSIADGATLSGSLLWQATPTENATSVGFYIDGALKWTEYIAPYVFNGDGNSLNTTTLPNGTHTLMVVATATDGSQATVTVTVTVSNSSTPFTTTSSIADGATLTGSVVWTATPSQPVSKVDFYVDGSLGYTDAMTPYRFNGDTGTLDTTTLTNASHTVKVVATATDGTQLSATMTVQVSNSSQSNTAGRPLFMEMTSSATDPITNNPTAAQQQWLRDHWTRATVFSTYFDSRTSWYPQGWVYSDAYAIYNPSTLATQHPEWILKDSAGNKLYIPWGCSGGTCPQYAADIGNPAWVQNFIDNCKALVAKGYKGLFIDDVDMDINVGNGQGQQVAPIDPRTGAAMTDTAWKSYFADFMEQVRAALPGVEITHNGVWFAGGGQHDGTNPYIAREITAANYVNVERGFNDGGLTGGTGSWSVYALMRFIDNVHAAGGHVVVQSYAADLTSAEYNLAAYLLINDGNDLVSSTVGSTPSDWWAAGYDGNLGAALGARYLWNGVWRRDFTGGIVLLNEPGATTKTLSLGATYTTTSGQPVSSVTLAAARGAVLKSS